MDKRLRYSQNDVHDISVASGTVRLWSTDGRANRKVIERAFQPLFKTDFVYPYVALMPDYHPGEGSMIGSVIPTKEVILPSVIGGDIGCGVCALRLPVTTSSLAHTLSEVHDRLLDRIPIGSAFNSVVSDRVARNGIWHRTVQAPVMTNRVHRKLMRQFSSLGGGNHFLELQCDQQNAIWVMLHSGSRYLGVAIQQYYFEAGRGQSGVDERLYAKVPYLLTGKRCAEDSLSDMQFAIAFARASRREMMLRVLEALCSSCTEVQKAEPTALLEDMIDVAHNHIALEEHFGQPLAVHRKGATRARSGDLGLIPRSMGTSSYVVEGRGNEFGFCSSSHGAGHAMSRGDAFRKITERQVRQSMEGVTYTYDDRVRDEAPQAYKNVRHVMRAQRDLVKIRHELFPVLSIKGH